MACWRCDAMRRGGARQGPAKLRGSFVRCPPPHSTSPLACRRTERGPAVHAAQPRAVAVCPYAFDHQPLWTDAACSDADAERDRFTLHCFRPRVPSASASAVLLFLCGRRGGAWPNLCLRPAIMPLHRTRDVLPYVTTAAVQSSWI